MSFRLTYATMFNPPEAMHERFEAAMARVSAPDSARATTCSSTARTRRPRDYAQRRSPIDSDWCWASSRSPTPTTSMPR